MCKAKAHTGLTQDQEQQLWGFQAQEHERVGFSLHTELTFINIYIYIYAYVYILIIHSLFKQALEQNMEMQYNRWLLQYTDASYTAFICEQLY